MATDLDLDAYFDRIGWGGPTPPTLETLAGLLDAHMRSVPFENLDVLLGRPIRLDLDALQDKLVRARRGGYCFEQATLFAAVLDALGFRPVRHTARVTLMVPRTASARTHMFLRLSLPEGEFVVDPGFGGLAPRVPLRLVDRAREESGETHWMARDGPWWVLKARRDDAVVDAWATTLDADNEIDFLMGNHFTSTFPASPFLAHLMLRAFTGDGRVTVINREATIVRGGKATTTELADRAGLRALLARHFGFDLPEIERLRVPSIPEWD